jgi:hypothetical protein
MTLFEQLVNKPNINGDFDHSGSFTIVWVLFS